MIRPIRWSHNDRYFGPFTYAPGDSWRLAIVLGSGDDGDYPGCSLRVSLGRRSLLLALPPLIRPWRQKVYPSSWDAETVARLGRDWYWDTEKREFGFSYSEGFLQVFRGRHTMDSSTDRTWSAFLPWTQWRHVRHSLYDHTGALCYDIPQGVRWGDPRREPIAAAEAACPTIEFIFEDFDGERLTVTTKIEEREWLFGTGWFKWLSLFRKPKIRRALDLRFSNETGKRKGSWKGGTMGTGINLEPGELHESGFRRYCAENDMTFIGEPPPVEQAAA